MQRKVYYSLCTIDDELLYNVSLPRNILEHVKKYHGFDDTRRSIIAYNKLKHILRSYSSKTLSDVYFKEKGKPCVEDGFISISHSTSLILVAYSESKIGVDIEKIGNASRGIYSKIFTRDEVDKATNIDFYKRWTLLEAKAKMNNTNIFDLKGISSCNIFTNIEEYQGVQYIMTIVSDDKDVIFEKVDHNAK